jgi:hypothetical protein
MKHKSVAIPNTIEILSLSRINPLISKCKIKVCYVGEQPNRNKSIITEDVARELANTLPGSPIVGFFNSDKRDFESHNEYLTIKDGKLTVGSETVPYGFVDLNARVWFEEYLDDYEDRRKYLCTEGYLWTGQYPEARLVAEKGGKPHSMELDQNNGTLDAFWTKDDNGNKQFFIINEAVISKLCILGSDVEPCFEGSSITIDEPQETVTVANFSLDEDFRTSMFNLIQDMKNILEGGQSTMSEVIVNETVEEVVEETTVVETEETTETVVETEETVVEETATEEVVVEETTQEVVEEVVVEETSNYDLNEVVEYQELLGKYSALETNYNSLIEEVESLRTYQNNAEKARKETLINSFSMLTDEDKEDVVSNIMNYSYDEIKSKLAVICVDKKVSFNNEQTENSAPVTFNLASATETVSEIPSWLKAVKSRNK